MKIFKTDGLDILSWCIHPDEGAVAQAENIAQLPFAYRHVALMPDTHRGFGMPIGGVLAAVDAVVPYAVGVDIGCGVLASRTSLTHIDRETLKQVLGAIRKTIPLGPNHRKVPLDIEAPPLEAPIVNREHKSARKQVGTLGGGNHFIEFQKGNDGHIWFMIHSGSRNLGKQVCDHYNALAKQNTGSSKEPAAPKAWDLAHLSANSRDGQLYINEMNYCLRFAKLNREIMSAEVAEILFELTKGKVLESYNVHHNYANLEHHYGKDVWVHRKGATRARKGELAVIPGAMGSYSYVVEGLGDEMSFCSSSHGAGRQYSRKGAMEKFSAEEVMLDLQEQGVVLGKHNKKDVAEESRFAYKNIDEVMENQKDLVKPVKRLKTIGVVKG